MAFGGCVNVRTWCEFATQRRNYGPPPYRCGLAPLLLLTGNRLGAFRAFETL